MAVDFSEYKNKLLFVPLGGSNEIGMNLNLYYLNGKWLMIDLGIGFVDDHYPGVEIMVPDIEFIVERKKDLVGLVLTHAHEDHLGAVPYLWDELQCPIYATKFTASVLKRKLQSNGPLPAKFPLHEVEIGSEFKVGPFTLDLIPLTHSIPEMQAVAIKTPQGVVMHTGDWKLDEEPLVGPVSDEATLKRYGDEGVLAMVCDSTNVFVKGESGSEARVRATLTEQIAKHKGRVFVATFASNIARVESVLYAAKACGRSVVLAGRSLWRMVESAQESGYLLDAPDLISEKEANKLSRSEVLVLCTGCQGEPKAALTKIVTQTHPSLRIASEDTVFFSSRVIPGNETKVRWLHNQLINQGVTVVTDKDDFIHVSGHPARDELKRMYDLVRPAIAVPVHGESLHIREHALFASQLGVQETVEPYNGAVILLERNGARIVDRVESGYYGLDGTTLIPLNSPIIKMRRRLRESGHITVSLVLDKDLQLISAPEISAPGCLDPFEDETLRHAIEQDILKIFERSGSRMKLQVIKDRVRASVSKRINDELGKKPVIDIHVHQL
ncbi:MAG: ribonuclease J [Alphaproteobacteria bacterium]|nr:MAG: ribonuclease J [Alphaproteobacteria bacterium]